MQARDLDGLSRSDLIAKAEDLGVEKANVLTRAELADEILRRSVSDPIERRMVRGLLGIARDLVARVVERGLHLPDAAAAHSLGAGARFLERAEAAHCDRDTGRDLRGPGASHARALGSGRSLDRRGRPRGRAPAARSHRRVS